jgi:hypothetical protein
MIHQTTATMKKKATLKKLDPVEEFLALSDAEKEAEIADLEKGIDESEWRPLTPSERRGWNKIQKSLQQRGRPTIGAGAQVLSVSIERGLLEKADAFAKRHKLKRSQMVAQGLRLVMQCRAG